MSEQVLSESDLQALYGEEEGPFLHRHSSLALVTGICVLLRERFSQIRKTPWDSASSAESKWRQDHTKATIHILTEYDDADGIENLFPRVTVQHQGTSYARVTVGDEATEHLARLTKGLKRSAQFGNSSINIEVLAARRGECALLADIVGASINVCTDILSRMMQIRDVQPVNIGPVSRQDGPSGRNIWRASIAFSLGFEATWLAAPIAPTLQRIELQTRVLSSLASQTEVLTHILQAPDPDQT